MLALKGFRQNWRPLEYFCPWSALVVRESSRENVNVVSCYRLRTQFVKIFISCKLCCGYIKSPDMVNDILMTVTLVS